MINSKLECKLNVQATDADLSVSVRERVLSLIELSRLGAYRVIKRMSSFLLAIVAVISLWSICGTPCSAQAVSWAELDIGSPAPVCSFTYTAGSPPQYSTSGAGSGFNGFGFDSLGFTE